jgi:hypothetical protein
MAVWSLREIFGQNSGKKIEGQEKAEKSRLHASFDFFIFFTPKKKGGMAGRSHLFPYVDVYRATSYC